MNLSFSRVSPAIGMIRSLQTSIAQRQQLALMSSSSVVKPKRPAHHMTWSVPESLPRTILDDGSVLITRNAPSQPTQTTKKLPPLLRPRKTHFKSTLISPLSPAQEQEIIQHRLSNPHFWTVSRLASEYKTYPLRILNLVQCPAERREKLEKEKVEEWENMSVGRKMKLLDRIRRKALW